MNILKSFVDSQGNRQRPGDEVPDTYDKPTLAHYERMGMIGPAEVQAPAEKPVKKAKPVAPEVTQAAAPAETKA